VPVHGGDGRSNNRKRWRFTRFKRSASILAVVCLAVVFVGSRLVSGFWATFAIGLSAIVLYLAGSAYLRRRFANPS